MVFEFLQPVSDAVLEKIQTFSSPVLGQKVSFHTKEEFPDLEGVNIAILGVLDNRGALNVTEVDLMPIRQELYSLFPGNWHSKIADIGNVLAGDAITDTHFLVKSVVSELIKNKIIPVVIGGGQHLTYALYRAYDVMDQMVNVTTIDSAFDIGNEQEGHTDKSYLSKIIVDKPNNLFNFTNIGYQGYYNSQFEVDLMDNLYFDFYRLGEVSADLTISEPLFRDTDLVSLDVNSIKSSATGIMNPFVPNGFDGKEICTLSRYAGISDKVTVFGLFNQHNQDTEAVLIAQIIWYFIEGVNCRTNEYPFGSRDNFIKYNVLIEDMELVFYKSDVSDRWWIQIPSVLNNPSKLGVNSLLPCTHKDYLKACENEVPERWWKAFRKN